MAKFSKNFKKNTHNGMLPKSVLKEINKQFKNFEYEENKSAYILVPKNKGTLSFVDFEIINKKFYQNKLKKENPSFDEIYSYSYNSQKSFDLKEKENSYMVVDGQKKIVRFSNIKI